MDGKTGRLVFFNGTVMRGQPAHGNVKEATFVRELHTAPTYRLYSIHNNYPAMIATSHQDGIHVLGELYYIPKNAWPAIEQSEPDGLYCDRIQLEGGEIVYGMLGTPTLIIESGDDISSSGGWVAHLNSLRS